MHAMIGSKWDEVLEKLIESVEEYEKVNRKDFVDFCLENKTTRSAAENFLKKCEKSKTKDGALALRKKKEGNDYYRKKKYEESLSFYTESIFLANKNDECLSFAYSNRSAVLQQMGHLLESLVDIDMALECGYPKPEMLILRKSKCLVQLEDFDRAKEVLAEALRNSEKKEYCQLIENELKKIKNLQSKKNSGFENKLPEPVGGENENFVSASKHLSIYYDETKGRHVIATKDIEVGDVLIVEKPFAFIIFKGCFNCAEATVAPIPCWNCLDACYCSPKCRDDYWESVHSFQCGFAELFKSIGIADLSLKIVLKASNSLNKLKKILSNISEPKYECGIVAYKSNGYDGVYNLVHNMDKFEASDFFQYVMQKNEVKEPFVCCQDKLIAIFALCTLKNTLTAFTETALLLALYLKNYTNYFPPLSNDEDLKLLTSVICRHILQLICNGHAIGDVSHKKTQDEWVLNIAKVRKGTAIYVSASMMNHSCEPSIISNFYNNWLIVRASKAIKKGKEVFNCYGPDARRMKRAERQEILSKQYFFKCRCRPCLQLYDIMDRFTAFKCSNCKGPSVQMEENLLNAICLSCGKTSEISVELANKFNNFYSLIKKGEVSYNDDAILSLKKFIEAWWIGRNIFYKFHKDLNYVADEVARCLLNLKDFRRCVLFLKCCILSTKERFGSVSIEVAGELEKLGDVILNYYLTNDYENPTRELAYQGVLHYQEAQRITALLCGSEHQMLNEIQAKIEILKGLLVI